MTPDSPPTADDAADHGDRAYTVEQILSGIAMGLIVLITFGNVVARYFTAQSFAATEEFSIALLLILSFLGSSAAFAFDRHIRVTFFIDLLPKTWRAAAESLSFVVTAALFGFIAFYAGRLTWDQYRFEETSPALGVPQWWYTVWMPALSMVIVLRLVLARVRRQK